MRLRNSAGRQQRLLARCVPVARMWTKNQREQRGTDDEQDRHQRQVVVGREDAHDDEDEAGGRQDRADDVEGSGRVGRNRILDRAAEQDDRPR